MKTTKHTTGRTRPEPGLTDAERAARFDVVAATVAGRIGRNGKPAVPAGPRTAADARARALGIATRTARVRPPD